MHDLPISRRRMIIGTGAGAAGAVLGLPAAADPPAPAASSRALRFGVIADVHQDVMHDGEQRVLFAFAGTDEFDLIGVYAPIPQSIPQ